MPRTWDPLAAVRALSQACAEMECAINASIRKGEKFRSRTRSTSYPVSDLARNGNRKKNVQTGSNSADVKFKAARRISRTSRAQIESPDLQLDFGGLSPFLLSTGQPDLRRIAEEKRYGRDQFARAEWLEVVVEGMPPRFPLDLEKMNPSRLFQPQCREGATRRCVQYYPQMGVYFPQ